jgi:hypothetical protein
MGDLQIDGPEDTLRNMQEIAVAVSGEVKVLGSGAEVA